MKAIIVAALVVLLVVAVSPVYATDTVGSWLTSGNQTTYTYILTSTQMGDFITSVHIYAPIDVGLIEGHTGPANWSFDALMDPDPEVGADIYWYANNYNTDGVANNANATFSITVPSWTSTNEEFVVPGCWGNWGFEIKSWPDSVMVWFDSVPVPVGMQAVAPDPGSFAALAAGCIALIGLRRRR